MLAVKDEETKTAPELFNNIKRKKNFPGLLIQRGYKRTRYETESLSCKVIPFRTIFGKIYSGIRPGRLKDWLLYCKRQTVCYKRYFLQLGERGIMLCNENNFG